MTVAHEAGHLNLHGTSASSYGFGSASRAILLSGIGYRGRSLVSSSSQCGVAAVVVDMRTMAVATYGVSSAERAGFSASCIVGKL